MAQKKWYDERIKQNPDDINLDEFKSLLQELVDENRSAEPKIKCTFKNKQWPSGCEDTGLLAIGSQSSATICPCRLKLDFDKIYDKIDTFLGASIDLLKHEDRAYQLQAMDALLPDRDDKGHVIGIDKGVWLYGPNHGGKSHLMGLAIKKRIQIESENDPFFRAKLVMLESEHLVELWEDQYTDKRKEAKQQLYEITQNKIIWIDDWGKLGDITAHRESQIYKLTNTARKKKPAFFCNIQFFYGRILQEDAKRAQTICRTWSRCHSRTFAGFNDRGLYSKGSEC